MTTQAPQKRLYRTREGAWVGGVCAGLAEYFELDTIVVRILAILLGILTVGLAGVAYLLMWALLPIGQEPALPYDVRPEHAESSAFGFVDYGTSLYGEKEIGVSLVARLAVAAGIMILFLVVALVLEPLVPGTKWWQFWPLGLLMIGLCFIIIPIKTHFEMFWHAIGIILTSAAAGLIPLSLGIMSWDTASYAFHQLWPILLVSFVVFTIGLVRGANVLMLIGAFAFVAFCLAGLMICNVPGDVEALFFHSPTGHLVRIALG